MKRFSFPIAFLACILCGYGAAAQVHIEPVNPTICPGQSVVLTVVADDPDHMPTVFGWSPPDGLDDPSAQTVTASPLSTTSYFVETNAGGASVTVTVLDAPSAGWEGLFSSAYCSASPLTPLVPADPSGVFTADPDSTGAIVLDMDGNWFLNPRAYPSGQPVLTVTYTVTNAQGCSSSSSRSTRIFPTDTVTFSGLSPMYCSNDPVLTLTGDPAGGDFSTDAPGGLFGNFLDPSQVPTEMTYGIIYAVTDTNNCVAADTQQFLVHLAPQALWFGISDEPFCASHPPIEISPLEAGGTFTATPAAPGAITNVGGTWYFSPGAYPGGASVSIIYGITNGAGCTDSFTRNVTIFPLNTASFSGLSPAYCSNDAPVTLTGSPAGGTFSTTAPSGLTGDQLDPAQVPPATTYDIIYTYSDGIGCMAADTQQFIVNQSPEAAWSGISDEPFCASDPPVELMPFEIGGEFTATPDAPGAITNLGGASFFNPSAYPGGASVDVTYTITYATGCTASYTRHVNVFALPAVSFSGLSPAYCANSAPVTLTGSPAGGTFSTTAPSGLTGNTLTPANVPVGTTFDVTYTYTNGSGCSNSATQSFTVNSLPAVSFCCLNAVYCSNDPLIILTGSPNGGTFSTTAPTGLNGNVLNPALFPTNMAYPVTYTYSNGGCSNAQSQSVLVHAAPTVGFTGLSPAYCADAPPVTLTGSPAGGTFSTTAPAGLSGNVLTPGSVQPEVNYQLTYAFTDANGCSNTQTRSFVVHALPTVDFFGLAGAYCADEPPVTLTGSPAGGIFSTDAPDGLTGNVLSPDQVPAGIFWHITYTYTDANGCTGSKTREFVVNALPGAGFSLPPAFCANDPALVLQGDPPGGLFSTTSPGGLNGNTLTPANVPPNLPYSITYTYTDVNGCSGSQTRPFIVHALPAVDFDGLGLIYCADEPPVILSGSPAGGIFSTTAPSGLSGNFIIPAEVPPGIFWDVTYTYTDADGCSNSRTRSFIVNELPAVSFSGLNPAYCPNDPAVTLTGAPAGGTFSTNAPGGLSGNILTPGAVPPGTTYTITYTYTDANLCTNSQTQSFVVQPLPVVGFSGLSATYCVSAPAVTLSGSPAGGVFSTTAPAGLSGNILTPAQVPVGTPYSITYSYTAANGCTNTNVQSFTVVALPAVSFVGLNPTYCANAPSVTLTGNPAGGVFSTTAPSGFSGGTLNPSQVPTGTSFSITYSYSDGNGCANSQTQSFSVLPIPAVSFTGLAAAYCADASPVTLTGQPAGGVFSTTAPNGLTGNVLSPALVPAETAFELTYTFIAINGCANADTQPFIVHGLPAVSIGGLDPAYCIDHPAVTLTGNPAGGVFSTTAPSGLSGNVLNPALVPTGTPFSINYSFTDSNGCSNQQGQSFIVHALPAVSFTGLSSSYCAGDPVVTLNGNPPGGVFSTNAPSGLNGNQLDPALVPTGIVYSMNYTYTDNNGCSNAASQVFMVNALPVVHFTGLSAVYCAGDPAVTLSGTPGGGVFTTDAPAGLVGDVLTPGDVPAGVTYHITYVFTNNNGCVSLESQAFSVNPPTPVAFSGLLPTYCVSDPAVTLTGSPAGGVFSTTAASGLTGNVFDPAQAPANTDILITYTFTDGNNCPFSQTQPVLVLTPPTVFFGQLESAYCANAAPVTLVGNPEGGIFTTTAPAGLNGNQLDPAAVPTGVVYTVTYTFSAGTGGGCSGSQTQSFMVNKAPEASLAGLSAAYCADAPPAILSGSPAGGSFSTDAPAGLAANVLDPGQVPAGNTYNLLYAYTDANGCSDIDSQTFIVHALPVVGFSGLSAAYCVDAPAVTLTGNPAGGTFSTTAPGGLSGDVLTPAAVPPGTEFSISYAYTDNNGCSGSQSQSFVVHPLPAVGFTGLPVSLCVDAPAIILNGNPAGGTFSGTVAGSLEGSLFTPSVVPPEMAFDVTYTYTDDNGCTNAYTQSSIVHALPPVSFDGLEANYCANAAPVVLNGQPGGGAFSTTAPDGLSGNVFNPDQPAPGDYTITYTYTDGNGCTNAESRPVAIHTLPAVSFSGLSPNYCANEPAIMLTGNPAGGVFTTTATGGLSGDLLNPAQSPTGTAQQLTYTYTDTNGCSNAQTQSYLVYALPVLSFTTLAASYCSNAAPVSLSGVPAGGNFSADPPGAVADLSPGSGFYPAGVEDGGNATIIYTFETAEGCTASIQQTTTVLPAPVFALPDSSLFCGTGLLQPDPAKPDWQYAWSTGALTPDLTVTGSGNYSLTVSAPNGCTASAGTVVTVNPGENFASNLLVNESACAGDTLHFFDITDIAGTLNGYHWDFGDGATSILRDPVHVYGDFGEFLVTLEGTLNGCTHVSVAKPVSIEDCRQQSGGDNFFESLWLYPNPTDDAFRLTIALPQVQDVLLKVVDQSGRVLETRHLRDRAEYQEDFSGLARGVYFVHIQSLSHARVLKVIVLE